MKYVNVLSHSRQLNDASHHLLNRRLVLQVQCLKDVCCCRFFSELQNFSVVEDVSNALSER